MWKKEKKITQTGGQGLETREDVRNAELRKTLSQMVIMYIAPTALLESIKNFIAKGEFMKLLKQIVPPDFNLFLYGDDHEGSVLRHKEG